MSAREPITWDRLVKETPYVRAEVHEFYVVANNAGWETCPSCGNDTELWPDCKVRTCWVCGGAGAVPRRSAS